MCFCWQICALSSMSPEVVADLRKAVDLWMRVTRITPTVSSMKDSMEQVVPASVGTNCGRKPWQPWRTAAVSFPPFLRKVQRKNM